MADIGILELSGILAAISAGLGEPIAVIKWCAGQMDRKIAESEKTTGLRIDSQGHKLANVATRMDGLEREHQKHIERTVRIEGALQNVEKGQERIEHQLDKMGEENATGRAEIIATIREMSKREVK